MGETIRQPERVVERRRTRDRYGYASRTRSMTSDRFRVERHAVGVSGLENYFGVSESLRPLIGRPEVH